MKGRKPKPAEMTDAKKSKLNVKETEDRKKAESNIKASANLTCPKSLSPEAQKEWRRLLRLYRKMQVNILSDLDVPVLSQYCEATAIWKAYQKQWKAMKDTNLGNYESLKTLDKIRKSMNDQSLVLIKLAEQLCITPLGRARMGIASALKPKENSLKDFMEGKDDDED